MTTHIFFDVDGVIIDGYHQNPDHRNPWDSHIEKDLGITQQALSRLFHQDYLNNVWIGDEPLDQAVAQFLHDINSKVTAKQLIDYWFKKDSKINRHVLEMADELFENDVISGIYLATNQEHSRAKYLWEDLGLNQRFDDIFYAAKLGVDKSEAAFFHAISNQLDIDPANCLQIDDDPAALRAARTAGWNVFLFDPPTAENIQNCRRIIGAD